MVVDVHGFGHTVGIEKEQIAWLQNDALLRVDHPFHGSDSRTVAFAQLLQCPVFPPHIRRIVSGVGVLEFAGIDVEDAAENRDEHRARVVGA